MARSNKGTVTRPDRDAVFHPEFREDTRHRIETDRKVALRLHDLIEAVMRDPVDGIGNPGPLKRPAPNMGSRGLTQEHRIVYLVQHDRIDFLQARLHYWTIHTSGPSAAMTADA